LVSANKGFAPIPWKNDAFFNIYTHNTSSTNHFIRYAIFNVLLFCTFRYERLWRYAVLYHLKINIYKVCCFLFFSLKSRLITYCMNYICCFLFFSLKLTPVTSPCTSYSWICHAMPIRGLEIWRFENIMKLSFVLCLLNQESPYSGGYFVI